MPDAPRKKRFRALSLEDQTQAELHAAAAQRYVFLVVEAAACNTRIVDKSVRQIRLARNPITGVRMVQCIEEFGANL